MSCPHLACIIDSLKKHRRLLGQKAAMLARDIAAVCLGLRSAIMVDYVPLSASLFTSILTDAQRQDQNKWPQLQLLQLDNCLYLVRRDALQSRLEQLSSTDGIPKYVTVCNTSKDCCLAVAPESEVQDVTSQLKTLCNLILSTPPPDKQNCCPCILTDLSCEDSIPIMPTMSGWLLQYPVVYLADQDSAVTLAKLLSEAVLVLYDVHIDGPLVKELAELPARQDQLRTLFSFTVPEGVLSQCSTAMAYWTAVVVDQLQSNAMIEHTIATHRLQPHTVQI